MSTPGPDPYAGKVTLGRMILDAAKAATYNEQVDPDLARLNSILACETFLNALTDVGCMITRIPTKEPR